MATFKVHLAHLRLRDFRNYARLDTDFAPGFHLFAGNNAQGKTNLLEAIYLLATLRSFRGIGSAQMVRHGQKGYFVGAAIVGQGQHEIKMYWSMRERSLTLNSQRVRKATDYLGVLRTVVFCTEDVQLIKGPGRARRRFLDLLLSQTRPGYLTLLLRYAHALRSRNALLKKSVLDPIALDSFTRELIGVGEELTRLRHELLPAFSPLVRSAYQRIATDTEDFHFEYQPSIKNDFRVELTQSQAREQSYRMTLIGPHRDEVKLLLNNRSLAQFGSEGQKRTLAIALKLAQAEYVAHVHGAPPVLLIDDVMGELDAQRRKGFLPLLNRAHETSGQVFMTSTNEQWVAEMGREVQRWEVKAGTIRTCA
jgi:DNA replication and repair protein RecF